MSKAIEGLRARVSEHPLAGCLVALVLGVVVAGGIASAVGASHVSSVTDQRDKANSELADVSDELADAEDERDSAKAEADEVTGRRDTILAAAKEKANTLVSDAKGQLGKLNGQIDDAQSSLTTTEDKLNSTQASLDQAQETKAMSSFGDGTYQADVDYLPGTYSSPGGGGCYWEKLQGPSGGGINNIIDNGGFDKNQIVSVDSPYFHTSGCGTWTRTGE